MNKTQTIKRTKPAITDYEFRCQACDYHIEMRKKEEVLFMAEYHMLSHEYKMRYGLLYRLEYDNNLRLNKRLMSELRSK
jgi:hypothetical protein